MTFEKPLLKMCLSIALFLITLSANPQKYFEIFGLIGYCQAGNIRVEFLI